MVVSIRSSLAVLGLVASTVAQTLLPPAVICIPGQCIQGYSNITLGSELSGPGAQTALHLLPGQYTSTTNPQALHDLLTSSESSLRSSAGLPSTLSLPLNLALRPGFAIFTGTRYSGQDAFSSLPESPVGNLSIPLASNSLALSENIWVAVASSGAGNNAARVVLWESVPDTSQIGLSSSLGLLDIQSTSCSPACSGAGVCSVSGQCVCPANFAGSSCELCAPGFFGPECDACPEGCERCDEGISGSGRCLSATVGPTDPRRCNCANGVCAQDGSCACNDGWVDRSDGLKCASCAAGFFLTSTGNCAVCQLGCLQCSDGTGQCNACRSGFTLNGNDRTRCDPIPPVLNTGIPCPENTFSSGSECLVCSSECASCSGPGANDCLRCATGLFMDITGRCVRTDSNGICQGTEMVADNVKRTCETCPAKCTSCGIANFNAGSTIDRLQCTQCLPGSVLANGQCVESCPAGSFVNPQDNLTCIPCSSSCATCAGTANFCLSCPNNQLAFAGTCVSSCPPSTFRSPTSSACLPCHPDCDSCTGSSFTQCTSCSANRPVLSPVVSGGQEGRCLPTCAKNQYFGGEGRGCLPCEGGCATCSGPSTSSCLSCASSLQVVRNGQCVDASCPGNGGVVPGLGVCLTDIVVVPSKTEGEPPLPTITGLETETIVKGKLEWWQILLMVLGCVFIFVFVLWCFRRRMRKQREKKTILFAKGKGIEKGKWKWGMLAAGWKALWTRKARGADGAAKKKAKGSGKSKTSLDGQRDDELPIAYYNHHEASRGRAGSVSYGAPEDIKMTALSRNKSFSTRDKGKRQSRVDDDLDSYIDAYDYSRRSSHTPSTLPDLDGYYRNKYSRRNDHYDDRDRLRREATDSSRSRIARMYDTPSERARGRERDLDQDSLYSEMTGMQRHTPEPRIPVKRSPMPISGSSAHSSRAGSPMRNNLLRKLAPQVARQTSDETLSSVVIAPQAKNEADALIGLDFGAGSGGGGQRPLPQVPYQASPFLSSIPVQAPPAQSMTPAQTYAMTMAPDLIGSGYAAPNNTGMSNLSGSTVYSSTAGGAGIPIAANVTGGAIDSGGGLYWLQPSANDEKGAVTGYVLKPAMTGLSGVSGTSSKNPFRV